MFRETKVFVLEYICMYGPNEVGIDPKSNLKATEIGSKNQKSLEEATTNSLPHEPSQRLS